jgi:hypothetical protein
MIRSKSAGIIGHQCALRRPDGANDFEKFRIGIAFNIELNRGKAFEQVGYFINIQWPDVTPIRTGMDGDAVSAGGNALFHSTENIGDSVVPGIAEQGNLVDVDAQVGHQR